MFILAFIETGKYGYTYVNGTFSVTNLMFGAKTSGLVDIAIYSISFSLILGIVLGCILSFLLNKRKQQIMTPDHLVPLNSQKRASGKLVSGMIHSAINDLIKSQYVVKDRERFDSLLQTPLRNSLEQLRIAADSLVENNDIRALNSNLASKNHYCSSYQNMNKNTQCKVIHAITEQVKLIDTLHTNIKFVNNDTSAYSPILPICSIWFNGAIRELLINAVKHNQKDKRLKIEINASFLNGVFIVCVADNGIGLSGELTSKLDVVARVKQTQLLTPLFESEEPINLVTIKRNLQRLNGSLEIVSAKHFLTKITLKIPLKEKIKKARLEYRARQHERNQFITKPNLPNLLLISQQNEQQLVKLKLLNERFNLTCTKSLKEGFALVSHKKLDCVLLDAELFEANYAITQCWLERNVDLSHIPLVILGNQTKVKGKFEISQAGISGVISQASDLSEIAYFVEKIILEKQRVLEQICEGIASYHLRLASAKNVNDQEDVKFLENFTKVLKENYSKENFNRPEAAKLMLMTPKTLARRLNQHYNLGFTDKLRQFRLHEAKELLVNGTNVTTAAFDTGFNSASYFTLCFRTEFGFPPSMLNKSQQV